MEKTVEGVEMNYNSALQVTSAVRILIFYKFRVVNLNFIQPTTL